MRIDIQRFHIEIDHVYKILLLLIVNMSFLLLVVLEDNHLGFIEWILVIKKSLCKLVNAKLVMKGESLQFTQRK
jgi:hypothetical protein